jgi:hypothetical protein
MNIRKNCQESQGVEGVVSKVGKVRTVACDVGGKISLFIVGIKLVMLQLHWYMQRTEW